MLSMVLPYVLHAQLVHMPHQLVHPRAHYVLLEHIPHSLANLSAPIAQLVNQLQLLVLLTVTHVPLVHMLLQRV